MIMIFRRIQDFFGYNLESSDEVCFEESVEDEKTPDDEQTKFEMTITDEIATAAEKKLYEATETINESLLGHEIDMEELKKQFEALDAPKTPIAEDRSAMGSTERAEGLLGTT